MIRSESTYESGLYAGPYISTRDSGWSGVDIVLNLPDGNEATSPVKLGTMTVGGFCCSELTESEQEIVKSRLSHAFINNNELTCY